MVQNYLQTMNYVRKIYHNSCMEIVSPQCAFSDVSENYNFMTKFYHNGCIGMDSPRCLFSYTLQEK